MEFNKLEETQFGKKELFKSNLAYAIKGKYQEVLKASGTGSITYMGAEDVALFVRKVFRDKLGTVPKLVEAACLTSCAILAPNKEVRRKLVKKAVGIGGGVAGIGMVITGIGTALGWGAGMIHTVIVFFTGASLAGPIGWVVGGLSVAAVAGYFAVKSDAPNLSEKFCNAFVESTGNAVDKIWNEYGDKLA